MPSSVRSNPVSASEATRSYPSLSSACASSAALPRYSNPVRFSKSPCQPSSLRAHEHDVAAATPYSHARDHAPALVNLANPSESSDSSSSLTETRSQSAHFSSRSSSAEALGSPSTSKPTSSFSRPLTNSISAKTNARNTPVKPRARKGSAAASSTAVKTKSKMPDDSLSSSFVDASAGSGSNTKSNRVLGPDGHLYTQGDAAKLGLIIRTACEACRNRKLKCNGTLLGKEGCERCNSEAIQCVYSARAPIGRPKKRKAELGDDIGSAQAHSIGTLAVRNEPHAAQAKCKSGSSSDLSPRVKTEAGLLVDFQLGNQQPYQFTASPASSLAQTSSLLSQQDHLFASQAPTDVLQPLTPHDTYQTSFVASHPLSLPESPLHTPNGTASVSSSSRLACTPTVYSQSQLSFAAVTPSDGMAPSTVVSPAIASTSFSSGQSPRPPEVKANLATGNKLPSLDDLSVAAFLQSLDTLEISAAELFQQQQQQQQQSSLSGDNSSSSATNTAYANGLGTPFGGHRAEFASNVSQVTASSVEEWTTNSAILQPGLSFAVPADFSWWDLGINGANYGSSAAASAAVTPSTEPHSMGFPNGRASQSQMSGFHAQVTDTSSMIANSSGATVSPMARFRRPTFSADQLWPRGADAGMGQGQIQHSIAATETGLGWSTLPAPNQMVEALSSPVEIQTQETDGSCCCSSNKPTRPCSMASSEVDLQQGNDAGKNAGEASCCSAKVNVSKTPKVDVRPPSCCSGKMSQAKPALKVETKSCCTNHVTVDTSSAMSTISTFEDTIEMGPLSTSTAVAGASRNVDSGDRQRAAGVHTHHPSKVHCVPNPSGKGCTCLCDMSVALLSVKQVLRETDPRKHISSSSTTTTTNTNTNTTTQMRNTFATDTIQLTLTASQAITAQCACSADCPTCQSDPSTEISASLLVSTALQIYARAVRILREGFAASAIGNTTDSVKVGRSENKAENDPDMDRGEVANKSLTQSFFGGLNVTIGTYKPSASNAKKIALYAIKLELKDLRKALGGISRMAQNFGSNSGNNGGKSRTDEVKIKKSGENGVDEQDDDLGGVKEKERDQISGGMGMMNPIDQLVILKLYRQLSELLRTVEGLEEAA